MTVTQSDLAAAPPHDIDAETSVLGAILLSDRILDPLLIDVGLKAEDFYRERHRLIYRSMLRLKDGSESIDALTVTADLRETGDLEEAGGGDFVHGLVGQVPSLANARQYGQIVKENALLRNLLRASADIQASVFGREGDPRELLEQAQQRVFEVAHDQHSTGFREIGDVLHDELEKLEQLSLHGAQLTGTTSGFRDLDERTGGFQRGNLIIVAARPSMGKSALVTNIAENAALKGEPVALFSLEMSQTELAQRFIASQAKIDNDALRKGKVRKDRWPAVLKAAQALSEAPLWIDDSSDVNILELRAKARRLDGKSRAVNGKGLGLIIVDYLQLLRANDAREGRVEQVSQMSRGLKILARELDVPVIAVSQLSRAVESRTPPRPVLSDLRECVTGDTLVLLADGTRRPIAELVGTTPTVLAIDDHDYVVERPADLVWSVGIKPAFEVQLASGRSIRATKEHRIRVGGGWQTVGQLAVGDRVACAATLPEPTTALRWTDDHVTLLGQMIGDGSYLKGQPMRFTSASDDNSDAVRKAAESQFGSRVTRYDNDGWHQLLISGNGNRWKPAGVGKWFKELGIFGQRSHKKRIPAEAFRLASDQIALLLRHLWATDGSIWAGSRTDGRRTARVAYSTSSDGLSSDVAALLLRLGIFARITRSADQKGRVMFHVLVSDAPAQARFLEIVGTFGPRVEQGQRLAAHLATIGVSNTNVDTLPKEVWATVRAEMKTQGVSQRAMAAARGTSYGGSSHFSFAPSRATVIDYAEKLDSEDLAKVADNELFWDRVVSIEPCGEEEVFDLTVPGPECWLADGIVSHNSGQIEQDADLVMFLYRDEYYTRDESERPGEADVIISKHRNGPIGDVALTFMSRFPKFLSMPRGKVSAADVPGEKVSAAPGGEPDLDEF